MASQIHIDLAVFVALPLASPADRHDVWHAANQMDTTAQYDAVRAYLKELDISSAVWIGLIRSNPDGDFTWTDYRGLSSDGYWSTAPDARSAPLCAAADPAADYRWEARACGGPSVASFICELPVPQWALGNEGCMVRALPALTILYLPESASVQLTADCGLAGVKRLQCTGNMKREDLLKELSCSEEEQTSTASILTSSVVSHETSTDLGFSDQYTNKEISTEEGITTEHEDDINQYSTKLPTKNSVLTITIDTVPLEKNVNLDIINNNNLLNNDIEKEVNNDDFFTNEESEKLEDEKNMQHKKLHDELARLGNFETIFNQPTDHFVPPLVMAKAKISDDMTALSIEEKLAQQLAERQSVERNNIQSSVLDTKNDAEETASTETLNKIFITDNPLTNILSSTSVNNYISNAKNVLPKKYNNKYDYAMEKNLKPHVPGKFIELSSLPSKSNVEEIPTTGTPLRKIQQKFPINNYRYPEEDSSLELTVIIKEPEVSSKHTQISTNSSRNDKSNLTKNKLTYTVTTDQIKLNDGVMKIEIVNEKNNSRSNIDITVYEVTTKVPAYKDDLDTNEGENVNLSNNHSTTQLNAVPLTINESTTSSSVNDLITASIRPVEQNFSSFDQVPHSTEATLITVTNDLNIDSNAYNLTLDVKSQNISDDFLNTYNVTINESNVGGTEADFIEHIEKNNTETTPEIDDFQSPLLSGASEPLHKPNRSRRPQQQNKVNKFNPFRILG
ncbi:unnamed protein product [Euphydryas editha]|uniref:C-type lectin domain-containing protein n=1 Tax=Euphydryas editha TaxID=104508 RepID=A0AAU9UZ22_EUPED|nr:unnamed protein product [Euphydryas editha]